MTSLPQSPMITQTTVNPATLLDYPGNRFDNAEDWRVDDLAAEISERGWDDFSAIILVGGRVANGRHRTLAARRLGLESITALEVDSDLFDEILEEAGDDLEEAGLIVEWWLGESPTELRRQFQPQGEQP